MKFFLLTDDSDTLMGMRLAGIEGKIVKSRDEAFLEYNNSVKNNVGILLITFNVAELFGDDLTELKKKNAPLLIEIPDSNPEHSKPDGISNYLSNAVGIKI